MILILLVNFGLHTKDFKTLHLTILRLGNDLDHQTEKALAFARQATLSEIHLQSIEGVLNRQSALTRFRTPTKTTESRFMRSFSLGKRILCWKRPSQKSTRKEQARWKSTSKRSKTSWTTPSVPSSRLKKIYARPRVSLAQDDNQ